MGKRRPSAHLPHGILHAVTVAAEDPVAGAAGGDRSARSLDHDVLAGVLDTAWAGVVLCDDQGRYVWVNPTGERILGRSAEELVGRPFADSFVAHDSAAMTQRLAERISHDRTGLFSATVAVPDGSEREITYSNAVFDAGDRRYLAAIFRDTTQTRQAGLEAAALAQTATQLATCDDPGEILAAIAAHAVDTTCASACGIAVVGRDGTLRSAGGRNLPVAMRDAVTDGTMRIADFPGGDVVLSGRVAELPDARADFAAGEATATLSALLEDIDWRGAVFLPMRWGGDVIGVFGVYLPASVSRATREELTFWEALSDQAATAVTHARLRIEREQHATVIERQRLARELHDSVSQALFSMTLHARTAQLALEREGVATDGAAGRSISQLRELTQGALAEMRALIFELRPDALAEEGLVAALRKQAAALASRELLPITVTGPDARLDLPPAVEEHLYRLALEALNNTVKHASATRATVTVSAHGTGVRLLVADDGCGFDPGDPRPGHLGLRTMRERATAAGAVLAVRSAPGAGTEIDLHLPTTRT
jgi:PAS domain S-box-containing protein